MPAIVSQPVVVLPGRRVVTEEICQVVDEQRKNNPEGVSDALWARWRPMMDHTQVDTRYWVREPRQVLTDRNLTRDLQVTVERLTFLAEFAAYGALRHADVDVSEVGAVVLTSTTGYAMPGIDVPLIERLGLSPRVRRIAAAQYGCAGAAWALARAREQVALYGQPVLVVAAEAFSSALVSENRRPDAVVWKTLGGDGAAAAVVREARDRDGGLLIDEGEAFEFTLPGSRDYYAQMIAETGWDFAASRKAARGVEKVCRPLRAWLEERGVVALQWAAVHTGGPLILESTLKALDLPEELLRCSWESMGAIGNCASVGVWDVVRRMYAAPPVPGVDGLVIAYGPGFSCEAVLGRWKPSGPVARRDGRAGHHADLGVAAGGGSSAGTW